jgi:hypothetical protein
VWVYAVVYSNYDPAEVNSLWLKEKDAEKRRDSLNNDKTVPQSDNWEISPMFVHEFYEETE